MTAPPPPILLLKTPSPNPATDIYTRTLAEGSPAFTPHYIPVLTHTLLPDPLIKLLITHLSSISPTPFPYGAIIITSQRAVAALSAALSSPPVQKLPPEGLKELCLRMYTVGPATARATEEVARKWLPNCKVCGGEGAGSGEILAGLILGDGKESYNKSIAASIGVEDDQGHVVKRKKPVLFLVGEKRRDVIPRMLQSPSLAEQERIKVDEMVVYQSGELEDFEFNFSRTLGSTEFLEIAALRWVVVFSPMVGKGMLQGLGWLDEGTGMVRQNLEGRRTFIACIGPTTRGYLYDEFGFAADVVAGKPSPEGLKEGIETFMREKGLL